MVVSPGFVSCGHARARRSQSYFCGGHAVSIYFLHRVRASVGTHIAYGAKIRSTV